MPVELVRIDESGHSWSEADVELAERYAAALERIKELNKDLSWSENDVELAERYVIALERINELE